MRSALLSVMILVGMYGYYAPYRYNRGYYPSMSDAILMDKLSQPNRMLMYNYYRQSQPPLFPYRVQPRSNWLWGW